MSPADAVLILSLIAHVWLALVRKEERARDLKAWRQALKHLEDSLYA